MGSPTETPEEWTAAALKLDAGGWRDAERCAAGELDYIEPHDDWCVDADGCRALLAYRSRVAAGLTVAQRETLAAVPVEAAYKRRFGSFRGLDKKTRKRPHLVAVTVSLMKRTRLGNEIARVLGVPHGE